MFGGYHPSLPTVVFETSRMFSFSYFADTFVFGASDPSNPTIVEPKWRQIITRGFPTPRCQSQMIVDPDTGKTYLFGGFTNSQFLPYNKSDDMKAFGDVWQLRVDLDGGFYDEVDQEEEERTAPLGPWKRCFNCGGVGEDWKKCGGMFLF